MPWHQWVIVALVFLNAAWMTFDGFRALAVGDYPTPQSGPNAGQLGPWADVVRAVGLEPRATVTKTLFVAYGLVTIAILGCFVLRFTWAWLASLLMPAAGLWHLPIGTLLNLVAIVRLVLSKPSLTP